MIDQSEAIAIARRRALELGWGFAEPIQVIERRRWLGNSIDRYEIDTGWRGTQTRFAISAETGEILSEGYIPR